MHEPGARRRVVRVVAIAAVAAAAGLPPPAGAQTSDEREAYAELSSAAADFERFAAEMPAAQRVLQAAERAHRAFRQADGRRDAAGERVTAASEQAHRAAVTCENRRCDQQNLIVTYPGIGNDYAAHAEAGATLRTAGADYVEAVGERGAGRLRQAASRMRSMANIWRGLDDFDEADTRRSIALTGEYRELSRQHREIMRRAIAAHVVANRAALRALERGARAVLAAADRLAQDGYPGTGAAAVYRARTALDRAAGNAIAPGVEDESGRTDAAVEAVMTAMRVTVDVLDRHLRAVDQEVAALEQRYAGQDGGAGAAPQEPAPPGGAPPPGAGGGGETPGPSSPREWLETVTNLLEEVEGYVAAAAETDDSVRCWNVAHAQNMASSRLFSLVSGTARPQFIPAEIAGQAREQLREREQAAQNQVREICANKPLP